MSATEAFSLSSTAGIDEIAQLRIDRLQCGVLIKMQETEELNLEGCVCELVSDGLLGCWHSNASVAHSQDLAPRDCKRHRQQPSSEKTNNKVYQDLTSSSLWRLIEDNGKNQRFCFEL